MAVLNNDNSNSPGQKRRGQSAAGANGSSSPLLAREAAHSVGAAVSGAGGAGAGGPNGAPGLDIFGRRGHRRTAERVPRGIPQNAMVVVPLSAPTPSYYRQLEKGPVAMTPEQMWKLLGFNGPAVQVQDDQGRPIAIGLEDLLAGLEKHWDDSPDDLERGRIYAQELMKYSATRRRSRRPREGRGAGGDGDDWLALGVAQLAQEKLDKAEGTLKGAQNLMKDNPYPSLHLAKLAHGDEEQTAERERSSARSRSSPATVDAWAYLYNFLKESDERGEGDRRRSRSSPTRPSTRRRARRTSRSRASTPATRATRDKAIGYAKKARRAQRRRSDRAARPLGALRPGGQDRRGREAPRAARGADAAGRAPRAQLLRGALPVAGHGEDHRVSSTSSRRRRTAR